MPKETEKGKKVTGTNIRDEAECVREGNHATTTDSSETEIKLPKAVRLAEIRARLRHCGNPAFHSEKVPIKNGKMANLALYFFKAACRHNPVF